MFSSPCDNSNALHTPDSEFLLANLSIEFHSELFHRSSAREALIVTESPPPYGPGRQPSAESLVRKPDIRVTEVDIGRFPNATAARAWALQNLRGKYLNIDTGWDIAVARSGIEKALSAKGHADALHIQVIAATPLLISRGVLVESRPSSRSEPHIRAIHRIYAPVLIGSALYRAKITIKERADGRTFYDQSLLPKQQSPAAGEALSRGSEENRQKPREPVDHAIALSAAEGTTGPTDLTISVSHLLEGVKYDDGLYVLDSRYTGVAEPSYHYGT